MFWLWNLEWPRKSMSPLKHLQQTLLKSTIWAKDILAKSNQKGSSEPTDLGGSQVQYKYLPTV